MIQREISEIEQAKIALDATAIAERLESYDPGGALSAQLSALWSRCGEDLLEAATERWARTNANVKFANAADRAPYIARFQDQQRRKLRGPIDARWIADMASWAIQIVERELPTCIVVSAVTGMGDAMIEVVHRELAGDPAAARDGERALRHLACVEIELLCAEVTERQRLAAHAQRESDSVAFQDQVVAVLTTTLDHSTAFRDQTGTAALSAKGMLGKAAEVAAAAEQSALAMREAAETAAGLIRAIEQVRAEVESAADIATRAAAHSAQAVEVSEALSGHAQAIESILGLIREIAGQTNLLALNATIEAARAGDAGRGFAVVAQEVKGLASQTARATDDIAAKIGAIQSASRRALDVNGSIRDIVGDVNRSAARIREAMETQARTVSGITSAVDETALSADAMSDTIAAIRLDTESVATHIAQLETGFRAVDSQLAGLNLATREFVQRIAS